VRRSSKEVGRQTQYIAASSTTATPSQNPRTYQEWKQYFSKLSKRRRRQIAEDEGFDGPEYETGVDY
jgi:hypothetical protein